MSERDHDRERTAKPGAHLGPLTGAATHECDTVAPMRAQLLELHDAHHARVVAFLLSNGASLHDAQDAAQEAFMQAWRAANQPGAWAQIKNPAAWIYGVALRRYRYPSPALGRPPIVPVPPDQLPTDTRTASPDPADLVAATHDTLTALAALDDDTRAVIAFQMSGFSAVETAAALDIDDQRVRNLRKKARSQLRVWLASTSEGGSEDDRPRP
ncbi:RNA polymerase sigma factor [Actinomadura formosensis]|uniref:RNA polymerase sigma factor n=1 Tax=Actinomadura formosensis TaxID=60706 RepID=UPI0013F172D4|nr:RNA polymerase sigma factor [Actinomadura formosensis]